MRVHVIPHDPFQLIPQKARSGKDPSCEARKFTGLENLVLIPSRDSSLRARPAVQIHDFHFTKESQKRKKKGTKITLHDLDGTYA